MGTKKGGFRGARASRSFGETPHFESRGLDARERGADAKSRTRTSARRGLSAWSATKAKRDVSEGGCVRCEELVLASLRERARGREQQQRERERERERRKDGARSRQVHRQSARLRVLDGGRAQGFVRAGEGAAFGGVERASGLQPRHRVRRHSRPVPRLAEALRHGRKGAGDELHIYGRLR